MRVLLDGWNEGVEKKIIFSYTLTFPALIQNLKNIDIKFHTFQTI